MSNPKSWGVIALLAMDTLSRHGTVDDRISAPLLRLTWSLMFRGVASFKWNIRRIDGPGCFGERTMDRTIDAGFR
ncbi:MAG TPA: MATE family efflux transporter, partial [Ochrobactrum anthropi]|nr:MATE family efflux transporter [Brucella anthropi]